MSPVFNHNNQETVMTDKQRPFGVSMTEREFDECLPADEAAFRSPIPTQVVSNGEYNPLPQTAKQKQVEFLIKEMADKEAKRHNTTRRKFLASSSGMAAAFTAMNMVYGDVFEVNAAEVKHPDAAGDRKAKYKGQFIFDDQTHFIRDDFKEEGLLGLTKWAEGASVNPNIGSVPTNLSRYKMDNYLKEIFLDSDTTIALLSGAPFDDPNWWLLSNDAIQNACRAVNKMAGSVRMLGHSIITPKYPNWMDEVDRAITELKPVSWKSYTIGDPFGPSKYAWRLDDEKLMYPFYEKAIKSGINTICIHKGLMPRDYEKAFAGTWENATVADVGQAAKDWPKMNFVIYHAALRPWLVISSGRRTWHVFLKNMVSTTFMQRSDRALPVPLSPTPCFVQPSLASWSTSWAQIGWSGAQTLSGTARHSGRLRRCVAWKSQTP
jgi:hypothetical protein